MAHDAGWRPLSPAAVLLGLGSPLRRLLAYNVPLGLIALVYGWDPGIGIYIAFSLVVFAMVTVWRTVGTLTTRVRLADGRLELREGVLQRRHRALDVARIQNVEVQGSVVHAWLGVLEVRVETASAGGDAEVRIAALERTEALALAQALRAGAPLASPSGGEPLHALGATEVLAHGATTFPLGGALLLAAALNEWGSLLAPGLVRPVPDARQSLAILCFATGATWAAGIGRSLFETGGFRLVRAADRRIRATRGWGFRRATEVPVRRLQAVAIREPWPLRILGYARLELDTAAAPRLGDDGRPVPTETTIPMVARERVQDLAGAILPGGDRALATPLTRAAPVATVRYALETALRALPRAALACWFLHSAHGAWLLLWSLLTGAIGGSMLRWGRTDTHLVTRTGWWTRTTWLVPRARVQQVTVLRDPVQREVGTATVRVAYAGGAVAVRDARVDDARALVAWLEGAGVSPTGPDDPIGP